MDQQRPRAYIGGKIFTADDSNPYADSMIVENGIITWIGKEEVMPAGNYERIVLNGRRVLPGFVDAHMHPVILASFSQMISCLPPKVHSIAELIEEIKKVRAEQGPDQWIQGWGYDEGKFLEKRSPNRYDLDQGCSDAPVAIMRTCAHIRCVNSKALEMAGITKDTQDPEGGCIDRDENGEPTGILRENAKYLINDILPETTRETEISQLVELSRILASQGVTAVTDMGLLDNSDGYLLYSEAAKRGFAQRVGVYYMWDFFKDDPTFTIPAERFQRDQQVRVAWLKLSGDGSVSGRTAWMNEPYLGSDDNCGLPVCTDEEIDSAIRFCQKNHCQLSIHSMGGRAIDRIVDRVYREENWLGGDVPYLRVEHVTEPSDSAIAKAAEKGFGFATQPIFPYCEIESYLTNLGPERTKKTYPVKKLLENGVRVCFSTDAPATSWAEPSDPFPCIKGGVSRYAYDGTDFGQDQRVDIETAIRLYTAKSANMAGFSGIGQLKKNYHADFIILSDDILAIPENQIDKVHVEQTYISGQLKYERKSAL